MSTPRWAEPNTDPEIYHRARIYTDEYHPSTGWMHFIVVLPEDIEDDTWKASQLAVRIMNDFSIFDGRVQGIYFNGEHDFDAVDVFCYQGLVIVSLEDLGS